MDKTRDATDATDEEYLTVAQAREWLGVTKPVIARLIREGILHAEPHPLDKRMKIIRRSEVAALYAQAQRIKKAPARAA